MVGGKGRKKGKGEDQRERGREEREGGEGGRME